VAQAFAWLLGLYALLLWKTMSRWLSLITYLIVQVPGFTLAVTELTEIDCVGK